MDIILYAIPIGVVIAFSLLVIPLLGGMLHVSNRAKSSLLPSIVVILGAGMALENLLSGRDLTYVGMSLNDLSSAPPIYFDLLIKFLNWSIFGFAAVSCFERIWSRATSGQPMLIRPMWFWILLIYSLTNGLTSSILGTHPSISPGVIVPTAILLLLTLDERWSNDQLLSSTRVTLLVILVTGFVVLPISPGLVLEQHVTGYIPFVHFRYWGAASHPNAIGPIAILFLLIRYARPFSRSWLNHFSIFVALLTILLSQSKTAIAGGIIAYGTIWLFRLIKIIGSNLPFMKWPLTQVVKVFVMAIGILGTAIFLLTKDFSENLSRLMASDMGHNISTLSGRTRIWEVAISEWRANPLFGYGPGLFDAGHRLQLGMNFAYHAHNQFLQSLAQSGLIGLAGLIILLVFLVWKSIKYSNATKGVSIAILVFVIVRCITEVPLRSGNMFSGEFVLLVVWVAMLLSNDHKVAAELKLANSRTFSGTLSAKGHQ